VELPTEYQLVQESIHAYLMKRLGPNAPMPNSATLRRLLLEWYDETYPAPIGIAVERIHDEFHITISENKP
jgi:hypothetical protein